LQRDEKKKFLNSKQSAILKVWPDINRPAYPSLSSPFNLNFYLFDPFLFTPFHFTAYRIQCEATLARIFFRRQLKDHAN
jgi:hypothetical protein